MILPYGPTNPPCYGQGSRLVNCTCANKENTITSTGVTYRCNENGEWDEDFFELECYGKCMSVTQLY